MSTAPQTTRTKAIARVWRGAALFSLVGGLLCTAASAQSALGDDYVVLDSRTTLSFDAEYAAATAQTSAVEVPAEGGASDFQQWREYDKYIKSTSLVTDLSPGQKIGVRLVFPSSPNNRGQTRMALT